MLGHYYKLYVPSTNNGQQMDEQARRTWDMIASRFMASLFGGATVTSATGLYEADGQILQEPITLITSFANDAAYVQHRQDMWDYARNLGISLGQTAVALEMDGRLYLVDKDTAEAPAEEFDVELIPYRDSVVNVRQAA